MKIFTTAFVKKLLTDVSGYYIYKVKDLPIGTYMGIDLKNKIKIPLKMVFDIGANVGSFSKETLRNNPESIIYAFEPVKSTYDRFVENLGSNRHMDFHQLALGNTEEKMLINIFDEKDSVLNSLNPLAMSKNEGKREEKTVQPGDLFCSRYNINHINLLKIDTEGFELNVLSGLKTC